MSDKAESRFKEIYETTGLPVPTGERAQLEKNLYESMDDNLFEEKKAELRSAKSSAEQTAKELAEKTQSTIRTERELTEKIKGDPSSITAPDMARPFAGNYPAEMPSTGVKDYILFSAYSNGVAGYTKAQTIGDGAAGNTDLEGTVQLYIPENIAMSSKVNYKNTDGSTIASAGNVFGGEGDEAITTQINNILSQVGGIVVGAVGESGAIAAQISADNTIAGQLGVGASNRHVLFEGVEFREFNYKYEFLPKSYAESRMLRNIVKFFRIQMLPTVRLNGNTFKPPHYFTIEYIVDGEPSTYLNKIKPCVCTSVEVSYGGNGQFAMLQSEGLEEPAPALINLDLSFQEVQLVSKTDAALGY